MGSIVSTGIGSGLDIGGIVQQLVQAEGAPTQLRLDREEARLQAELSALGSFRSVLDRFRQALAPLTELDAFRGRTVASANEDVITGTASETAAPGRYAIEVESLASAQKLASGVYSGPEDVVGTGTLTLASGGGSFTVDAAGGTLAAIRDAINGAPDNTGIRASLVNGADGTQLVLSAEQTGAASAITVTSSGGGLAALEYDPAGGVTNLSELAPAANAVAYIDTIRVESETNVIADAVEGLELELGATTGAGETVAVQVGIDRSSAREKIEAFVNAYNELADSLRNLTRFNPETQEAGPLLGDATARGVGFQLRRALTAAVPGLPAFGSLVEIGITTDLNGKLEIDATRLDEALDADLDGVGQLFASPSGLAGSLDAVLAPYLDAEGTLDARTEGLRASIDDVGDRREALARRLEAVEARLQSQFNALDSLLAQLQSTGNFLTQQLASLPGSGSRARSG